MGRCYIGTVTGGTGHRSAGSPVALGWRRFLLTWGLLLVALSVVGMHQLSVGHAMVTSNAVLTPAAEGHIGHQTRDFQHSDPATAAVNATRSDTSFPAPGNHIAELTVSGVTVLTSVLSADTTGCSGCSKHTMVAMTCLLVLTALILPSPHRRPPQIPSFSTKLRLTPNRSHGRVLPALSLVELSLRRT